MSNLRGMLTVLAAVIVLGTAGANLSVQMLSGTNPLNVRLDTSLTGNLTVNLATGARTRDGSYASCPCQALMISLSGPSGVLTPAGSRPRLSESLSR